MTYKKKKNFLMKLPDNTSVNESYLKKDNKYKFYFLFKIYYSSKFLGEKFFLS